ncbi:hypothetical protein NH44784_024061 [Achromobacter xylosoxidans NH44784-1996]|nr:hypothetical protein NH44784_024061 [Achromobacter xylosoxidans NH44784-1996]
MFFAFGDFSNDNVLTGSQRLDERRDVLGEALQVIIDGNDIVSSSVT